MTTRTMDPWNLIDPKTRKPAASEAGRRRAHAADRAQALSVLGWTEGAGEDRLVYTTGELWQIVRELGIDV